MPAQTNAGGKQKQGGKRKRKGKREAQSDAPLPSALIQIKCFKDVF